MAFIVTLTLCAAAPWGATSLEPTSLAPLPVLQEPEEGGGPPAAPFEAPPLCPEPLITEPRWAPLELTSEGRIVFTNAALEPLAEVLAEDFAAVTGLRLSVAGIPARSGDIVLSLGYMPDTVRENPEGFFIEVFDHVLIAGQSLEGAARATARFLQLVRPPEAAQGEGEGADPSARATTSPRIAVPALRIVDAPSIRWRMLEIHSEQYAEDDPEGSVRNARSVMALAHLSGHSMVYIGEFGGVAETRLQRDAFVAALLAEGRRRQVALVVVGQEEIAAPLRVLDPLREKATKDWAVVAADLERADAALLCGRDPFRSGATTRALGPDEVTAARRLPRLLHPIAPVGRAVDAAPLLGVLYGHRIALGSDSFLPVGWKATLSDRAQTAALAGEAWHGGMRVDALRGAGELERVLAAVDAALRRRE